MNETTLSENPSSRPTMKAFAPRTLIRKNGRIGRIISLLMSVKRDTTPRTTTFAVSPYARDRRGEGMGAPPAEEKKHPHHRVHHHNDGPLVTVAFDIPGHRPRRRRRPRARRRPGRSMRPGRSARTVFPNAVSRRPR